MRQFSWRTRCQIVFARLLIRLGKLTHVDYTLEELQEIIDPHFPQDMPVAVPYGKGNLKLLAAELDLKEEHNQAHVQLLGSLDIEAMGNPIYRAHVVAILHARPVYCAERKQVRVAEIDIKDVYLLNDEYSLIKDTSELLGLVMPKPMQSLLGGTVKSAVGLLTGGMSDTAMNYLNLYLTGSKHKVLDYHLPQLRQMLRDMIEEDDFCYELNHDDWQEYLFARQGKEVVIEENALRFKL